VLFVGEEIYVPVATRAVQHRVRPGESVFQIARRYGVPMSAIVQTNRLARPDLIYAGQVLTIPVPAARVWSAEEWAGPMAVPGAAEETWEGF